MLQQTWSDAITADACRRLWCDVVRQGVEDAMSPEPEWVERDFKPTRTKSAAEVRRAALKAHRQKVNKWRDDRAWIGSKGFRECCYLSGIDPDAAEQAIRRKMQ